MPKRSQVENTAADSAKMPAKPLGWSEKITAIWYLLDAFTHLSIEQIYCILTFFYNGARNLPNSPWSSIWIEYSLADKRWAEYDTTVLSLELLTVYVMGPLALLGLYGVSGGAVLVAGVCSTPDYLPARCTDPAPGGEVTLTRKPWRHVVQIIICACELYGGFMTFAPEWLARPVANPNLSNHPLHAWIHLTFMNGLWVLVPAILLVDSCITLTRAASIARIDQTAHAVPPSGNGWYTTIAASLVLYVILVPAVMIYAKSQPHLSA